MHLEYYQHKYGGVYRLDDVVDSVVKYTHVYPFDIAEYERPMDEFFDGRFRKLTFEELTEILNKEELKFQTEITVTKALAKR